MIRALSEASESIRMCEGSVDSVLEAGKKSGTAESKSLSLKRGKGFFLQK